MDVEGDGPDGPDEPDDQALEGGAVTEVTIPPCGCLSVSAIHDGRFLWAVLPRSQDSLTDHQTPISSEFGWSRGVPHSQVPCKLSVLANTMIADH